MSLNSDFKISLITSLPITNSGVHIEPGPNGGIVVLDDPTIYDMAVEILQEQDKE